jgi:hypothetical protein
MHEDAFTSVQRRCELASLSKALVAYVADTPQHTGSISRSLARCTFAPPAKVVLQKFFIVALAVFPFHICHMSRDASSRLRTVQKKTASEYRLTVLHVAVRASR